MHAVYGKGTYALNGKGIIQSFDCDYNLYMMWMFLLKMADYFGAKC